MRKATIADVKQLALLFDAYRVFYNKESDLKKATEFLTERINKNDSEIFVAEINNNPLAGFVQLYPIFSSTQMKRLWLLNDLYVHPDYRGRGISIELINKAKTLSRETKAAGLLLETSKSNIIGNLLYVKTGFVLDNEHHYYTWED